MGWRTLLVTGVVLTLAALIALMPMRFVHGLAGQPLGTQASVYGRVWDGRIYNAAAGRARFDQVEMRLRPLSLLTGAAVFDWTLSDPEARGQGAALAGPGGAGLRDARLTTTLRGLGLDLPALDPAESASFEIDELRFGSEGCTAASGHVRTAALIGFARRHDVEAPLLDGPISCENGVLGVALAGTSAAMSLDMRVTISPTGLYRWTIEARLMEDRLTAVFSAAGFTQDGETWRLRGEGQI